MAVTATKLLKPLIPASVLSRCSNPASLLFNHKPSFISSAAAKMATSEADTKPTPSKVKIIDSHLHVWASPEEVRYSCCIILPVCLQEQSDFRLLTNCWILWRLLTNFLTFLAKNPPCPDMSISCCRSYLHFSSPTPTPIFYGCFRWLELQSAWLFIVYFDLEGWVDSCYSILNTWTDSLSPCQIRLWSVQCMEEAGVDGALIVQPINHKFDHSLVTRSVDITFLAKCSVFVLFSMCDGNKSTGVRRLHDAGVCP